MVFLLNDFGIIGFYICIEIGALAVFLDNTFQLKILLKLALLYIIKTNYICNKRIF